MAENKYVISFIGDAYNKATERSNLSDTIVAYDKNIGEMNDAVEALDRYDDFAAAKIAPAEYETKSGVYGIRRNKKIHSGDVILDHQQKAALAFLKELRGFGLLADVVGSGKTFEACTVLSELSVRGNIDSMLLIVPDQVYDSWVDTLEHKFGLGEGVLHRIGADFDIDEYTVACDDGFLRPAYPMIVLDGDFVRWSENVAEKVLFDVVVVDEAHHLCGETGDGARAMKMLSLMMKTKTRAQKPYCLLLSATPHSGNLAHMFRLWYFIRCKGGNPSDFDEKDDGARTAEYNSEKAYYNNVICRGATTVMEFIRKVTVSETAGKYGAELESYAAKHGVSDFDGLADVDKWNIVGEFLADDYAGDGKIARAVNSNVSKAYHDGVLHSIMIRQPSKDRGLLPKKEAVNYLYVPYAGDKTEIAVSGHRGERIKLDLSRLDGAGAVTADGESFSLVGYVKDRIGQNRNSDDRGFNRDCCRLAADIVYDGMFKALGLCDDSFENRETGSKQGAVAYYKKQALGISGDTELRYVLSDPNVDEFERKMPKLKELLDKHEKERVIIFFDYDLPKRKRIEARVEEALRADPKYAKRLLVGTEAERDKITSAFVSDKGANAILIVKDAGFTEGVNLQKCSIIINMQVTPDPLAMDQRIGRIFRLGQDHDVTVYSLADMSALEGYVLMYFARIGLMSSNSGDATIIAGSNNERMVTVRCPVCGNVKLLSQEDYESAKRNRKEVLYCGETEQCMETSRDGTLMEEISVYDFRCDTCDSKIERAVDGEGYKCMSVSSYNDENGGGIMCNCGDKGDRELYCRKICAIAHCHRFRSGPLKNKCPALKAYLENGNTPDADLMAICDRCKEKLCFARCRIGTGKGAIAGCSTCDESSCTPKPHVLRFDDRWEALCPSCDDRRSKIRPIATRTFATFIRSAWEFRYDGGRAFCSNLTKETEKVEMIKDVLENDDTGMGVDR